MVAQNVSTVNILLKVPFSPARDFSKLIDRLMNRYYEGGVSSVYIWEDENGAFVACFLIKKGNDRFLYILRQYLFSSLIYYGFSLATDGSR